MSNNQQFDDHIKELLSSSSPDVPPHIWENIVAKGKSRKPGLLIFLLHRRNLIILLCILLAGGSGAWLLNNTFSSSADEKMIAGTTAKKETPDKNNTTTDNGQQITGEQSSANIATPITINKTATGDRQQATTNDAVRVVDKNYLPSANKTATDKQPLEINDEPSANKNSLTRAARTKIETYPATADENTKNNNSTYTKNNNSKLKTNAATKVAIEEENENDADEVVANGLPVGGTLLGRLTYGTPEKRIIKTTDAGLNKRSTPNVVLPKCPVEKNISGNKKYVEVYGSYDYGLISLKDSSGNSSYLQKRKESTSFTSAYSAGLRYTRVFNNSMSVRGGFNFSQINEKFTLVQGNVIQVIYIIDANGDTTGSYTTTGTRYKTTHNKYRTVDIPLMIGYEMGNGRFHTNINVGPVINIYSWQRGEVLDKNGQPVSITTGKSNSPYGFKTNAGIGFMGAVSVYYKLTEKLHVLAEPYFRYNFNQMNKENITLKQKYNTIGVRLGLRLDIP